MIAQTLEYTKDVFNKYVMNKFGLNEDVAIINKIIDNNGNIPPENINKVVLSLIHIEQEINRQFYNRSKKAGDGIYTNEPFQQCYNFFILVAPYFEDYNEDLKFLNTSIAFFQENSVLDGSSYPSIPEGISRLEFQLEKGDGYMQMHNLWTALGAKYKPSVIYKVRVINVDSNQIEGVSPSVLKES